HDGVDDRELVVPRALSVGRPPRDTDARRHTSRGFVRVAGQDRHTIAPREELLGEPIADEPASACDEDRLHARLLPRDRTGEPLARGPGQRYARAALTLETFKKLPLGGTDRRALVSSLAQHGLSTAEAVLAEQRAALIPQGTSIPGDVAVVILGGSNG